MSITRQQTPPLATSVAAAPGLLQQVGMAGSAAVITVSFIHPIDVVKVSKGLHYVDSESNLSCNCKILFCTILLTSCIFISHHISTLMYCTNLKYNAIDEDSNIK